VFVLLPFLRSLLTVTNLQSVYFWLALTSILLQQLYQNQQPTNSIIMSYKAGIAAAIADMKERNGSSLISIKKWMQAKLPADKKWLNAQFLQALKTAVTAGELVKVKVQYYYNTQYLECTITVSYSKHVASIISLTEISLSYIWQFIGIIQIVIRCQEEECRCRQAKEGC
jgi:RNA-binding protein YhbY